MAVEECVGGNDISDRIVCVGPRLVYWQTDRQVSRFHKQGSKCRPTEHYYGGPFNPTGIRRTKRKRWRN